MANVSSKQSVNTFSGGMNLDIDISNISQQQYRYAENLRLSTAENSTLGALSPTKLPLLIEDANFNGVSVVATISIRDIGIVFANSGANGIIYRILHNNGNISSKTPLFTSGKLFSSTISLVANYEAPDNIRVYFAEEGEPIRVINVSEYADSYNSSISGNIEKLNCIATDNLDRPSISTIGTGRLNSGKIQYAYSLYSKLGSQTVISPLSEQVSIFDSGVPERSVSVIGSNMGAVEGEPAGKSVSISISLPPNSKYTNIEIFSVYYMSSSATPIIRLIGDMPISGSTISFTDSGSSMIGELTIGEFNAIGSFIIGARRIESKDDILFAADVKELIPEIEPYDVRAYSYNINGVATLHSEDGSHITINENQASTVSLTHDCINKSTYTADKYSDVTDKYIPGSSIVYGGIGPNVRYTFANTYLIESYGNKFGADHNVRPSGVDKYIDDRTARIGDVRRTVSSIRVYTSDYQISNVDVSSLGISRHTGYLNYADPMIASKLASYHRDEIYRFGAVLYDNHGNKSDVRWIADIRFPAGYIKSYRTSDGAVWSASSFEAPDEVVSAAHINQVSGAELSAQELLVKPMGLKFEFSNIPPSISRIEVVRSKRDLLNRTIYAQGVVQKTGTKFKEYINNADKREMPTGLDGSVRPHQVIAMGYSYSITAPLNGYNINNPYSPDFQPMGMYAYAELGNKFNGEYNIETGRAQYNYTDHALSPYHYNKNLYLFINPETSFYKKEFVDGIKKSSSRMNLVVGDIVYPKSTPPLYRSSSATPYYPYFGNSTADAQSDIVGGKERLTMMHFAADITDYLYSRYGKTVATTNPHLTTGLVGVAKEAMNSFTAYQHMSNNVTQYVNNNTSLGYNIQPTSITDITNDSNYTLWQEPSVRAYISLGKHINQSAKYGDLNFEPYMKYSNGYDLLTDKPAAKSDNANSAGIGSATFKYFYNYNKKIDSIENSGGEEIHLIYQNGNNVMSVYNIEIVDDISSIKTFSIEDIEYSGDIQNGVGIEAANSNYISIGNKQYLNWSKSIQRGDNAAARGFSNNANKARLSGIHGDGIVMSFDNNNILPSIASIRSTKVRYSDPSFIDNEYIETHGASALSTFICNIKSMGDSIYGGNTYSRRQYSEYIPTGSIFSKTGNSASGYVFGGDTYIGLFDYSIVKSTDPIPDSDLYDHDSVVDTQYCQTGHIGALIPLETSINMRVQSGMSHVVDSNPFIQSDPGVYGPGVSAGASFTRTQTLPQFKYNSAYSAEQFVRVYMTRLVDDEPVVKDYRVYASDKKSYDESTDSWAVFKPANYIDLDSRYGAITRLKSYANRLFFWQENAMGVLSVNDRSLIQDNNESALVLGSGGVLDRYEYITTSNGLHKDAVSALTCSMVGMYWYDHKRAEICLYSGQVASISKTKGVQTILNKHASDLHMNIPMSYNRKYNEVLITLAGTPLFD